MTSRERIFSAVKGEIPDRIPFSMWYHFRLTPPAGANMAQAELEFYDRYKPDMLKVMHDIPYEPVGPIREVTDWANLPELDPTDGNFGKQLETLKMIRAGLDDNVPMIDTVFGVYNYADKLSNGRLLDHLTIDPDVVGRGLCSIAVSLERYAKACIEAGCEGIYYALTGASAEGETAEIYKKYFLEYDRLILSAVKDAPLSVIHLHGYKNLYFDLIHELPASVICWSDRAAEPNLSVARTIHSGCLMGGLDETKVAEMSIEQIQEQARDAIRQIDGKSFILAPGCAIPEYSAAKVSEALAGLRSA
ncbi:MAG: uroporphyrinogen decarboxylase family protein [bacterium]